MKKQKYFLSGFIFFCVLSFLFSQEATQIKEENLKWGDIVNGIKIGIIFPNDIISLEKSTKLHLLVKNDSENNLSFQETAIQWDFSFKTKDGDGIALPLKCDGTHDIWKSVTMTLRPSKTYHCHVDMKYVCDFKKAGSYTIQVSRKFSFDGKEEFEVKSNIVTLTVKDDAPKETGTSGKEAGAKKSE